MYIKLVLRLKSVGAGIGLFLAVKEYVKRRNALDLQGQVVLVTGGSRGLGLALAQEFAQQGAHLVICARQAEPLEIARQQLVSIGAQVLAVPCDISKQEQVAMLIEEAIARFGRVDILVNNAGIITVGPQQTMTLQDYETSMGIMFWGAVYTSLAVLEHMRARKSGHIVNITSIGGKVSVPHLLPYCSAKFAELGFSEGLHAEVARDGIKVTTIVPGLMRTGSHINAFVKGKRQVEYALFGLLATLPVSSISASSAARQIVRAVQRGETEVILSPQAQLLGRLHGLFPGLTIEVMSLVNRMLPTASGAEKELKTGRESRSEVGAWLTGAGEPAAHAYNQYTRHTD